jgi:hypothetical protein
MQYSLQLNRELVSTFNSVPYIRSMRHLATILVILLLAVPAMSVELFRYRYNGLLPIQAKRN